MEYDKSYRGISLVLDPGGKVLNKSLIEKSFTDKSFEEGYASIEKIKKLYAFKRELFSLMRDAEEETLPLLQEYVEAAEYALQRAWGFPEDRNYHRFWLTPRCLCPRVDNDDSFPYGYYVYNSNCPVHCKMCGDQK